MDPFHTGRVPLSKFYGTGPQPRMNFNLAVMTSGSVISEKEVWQRWNSWMLGLFIGRLWSAGASRSAKEFEASGRRFGFWWLGIGSVNSIPYALTWVWSLGFARLHLRQR